MNKLKKIIINAVTEEFDKVYIHALPHHKLIVGERGLINSEKHNGIVLAIGSSSCSEFKLEDDIIFAKLRFNGVWEDVFIPYEAVDAVLNDLHKPLCIFNFPFYEENNKNIINLTQSSSTQNQNNVKRQAVIVKPNFNRK